MAEFISKMEGALQELEESAYWFELLPGAKQFDSKRLAGLMHEADELIAIFTASVKTEKQKRNYLLFVLHPSFPMPLDFFDFFRYALGTVATIYATVITLQSLWGWYVWLAANDRYIAVVRRYLIVHGLRLRFRTFWGDVIICLLLCVAFVATWRVHVVILQLGTTLQSIKADTQLQQKPHAR